MNVADCILLVHGSKTIQSVLINLERESAVTLQSNLARLTPKLWNIYGFFLIFQAY